MRVSYLTDVEGRWEKLETFAAGDPDVTLEGDRLSVREGALFVFGGDAIDRGPHGRRFVATLLDAKRRQPDRVVLLAGNRDLNKMRLPRELAGVPHPKAPPALLAGPRAELLRWTFERTMGAKEAFENRRAELAREGRPSDDEAVVASYLEDLRPDGALSAYLAACQLAHRVGGTLFVHGAVTEENLGHVPDGEGPTSDLSVWIDRLNAFHAAGVKSFREDDPLAPAPRWLPLVAYQAPVPGTNANQASVIYGRPTHPPGNPVLPSRAACARLVASGVHRVVLGHTPSGDCPAILRGSGLEVVLADNSYGRVELGSRVAIEEERLVVSGLTELDSGEREPVRFELARGDAETPLGLRERATGRLVKARLGRGDYLSFLAVGPGRVEQRAVPPEVVRRCDLEEPAAP